MKPRFAVFDLDGTLADGSHRQHLAEAKMWEHYFDMSPLDTLRESVARKFYDHVGSGDRVEIWTARRERHRDMTDDWLRRYDLWRVPLRMRGNNDRREPHEAKLAWVDQFGRPDVIYEDDDNALEGFGRLGSEAIKL